MELVALYFLLPSTYSKLYTLQNWLRQEFWIYQNKGTVLGKELVGH